MCIKKFFARRNFFAGDYALFTTLVSTIVIIFSALITYFIYQTHLEKANRSLRANAERIDIVLTDIFDETSHLMIYLGKEISNTKGNLSDILKVLINESEVITRNKAGMSWPMFDWIDDKDFQVINQLGIVRKPISLEPYDMQKKVRKNPWAFHLSRPIVGTPSGCWIIPATLGITDSRGKFLGTLASGLEISRVSMKIQQLVSLDAASFIILDKELRVIIQSVDNGIDLKSSYYRDALKSEGFFKFKEHYLETPVVYKDIKYNFYKKMSKYPYIILLGFNKDYPLKEFLTHMGPRLLEIWILGFLFIILLYFFRKKILKLIDNSKRAEDKFMEEMRMSKKDSEMTFYRALISKSLKVLANMNLSQEDQEQFIEEIYDVLQSCLSPKVLDGEMKAFDANKALYDCLSIFSQLALVEGVTIKENLDESLPLFYGKELELKKVFISFLSLIIEFMPQGGFLKVFSRYEDKDSKRFVFIFKDNGMGLSFEHMLRLSKKNRAKRNHRGIATNIPSVERIMENLQAECCSQILTKGKKLILKVPHKEPFIDEEKKEEKENVISFPTSFEVSNTNARR